MKTSDCTNIDNHPEINFDAVEQLFKKRRSIRHYKQQAVEQNKIEKLIDIGNYAPTGRNAQEISWIVVNGHKKVNILSEMTINWMKKETENKSFLSDYFSGLIKAWDKGYDSILRGAPSIILAIAPQKVSVAIEDGATAISHIELAAPSLDLGSCWAGFLYFAIKVEGSLQRFLSIPEDHLCVGAAMIGYPKYKFHRIPQRNTPKILWK